MATSVSSSASDGFGLFMRGLEEKSLPEIDRNCFGSQNVLVLRKYLVLHGVQTSDMGKAYSKEKLVNLAFQAWKLRLKTITEDSEDTSKLILEKHKTPDGYLPLVSSIKEGWSKDFSNAPSFSYADLYNYMIMKPGYDHDGLKAYKGLHGYKLYEAGHVVNLERVQIKDSRYSFVRFKVCPTEKKKAWTGKPHYEGWVILKAHGEVLSGHCNCFGGADGACRHLSASLFDLQYTVAKQTDLLACTSKKCMWNQRKRDLAATPVTELILTKRKRDSHPVEPESPMFDPRPRSVVVSCDKRQTLLQQTICELYPGAVCLDVLPEVSPEAHPQQHIFPIEHDINVMREEEVTAQPHAPYMCDIVKESQIECFKQNLSNEESLEFSKNYILNYTVSKKQKDEVCLSTVGQSCNENWFRHRIGRITGSVAHRVLTRRETTDPSNLVSEIMGKKSFNDDRLPPQIKYGRMHEEDALKHYISIERLKTAKFSVSKTGLVLLNNYPFLGASPDGITSNGKVVEVKCSWKFKEQTPKEAAINSGHFEEIKGELQLKKSSPWYTQLQFEMAVCELKEGVLILYTDRGVCTVSVLFDEQFWNQALEKLKDFFIGFVLPELLK